ncbi:hypothetical protein PHYPSEUDO_014849 [Phytophthora pseudosyringae]|uniref:Uncharacterized protein n=1 Tax=Phytophthora pseudosyringae TaxID=221518 RepID=A0A8T1V731_9STRA|nr:hypothetical protein PHYPSEUDO_014849 [Phytophthora pseudosyringae]
MSIFESYRSASKGCAPNLKLQKSPTQRSSGLQIEKSKFTLPFVDSKTGSLHADVVKSGGLQPSVMALGTFAAFGAASYGLLRAHCERNVLVQDLKERERNGPQFKERQRVELERGQRGRMESDQLFQIAVTSVLLAVAVLASLYMYIGWFFLLLAAMIAFALFVCTFL